MVKKIIKKRELMVILHYLQRYMIYINIYQYTCVHICKRIKIKNLRHLFVRLKVLPDDRVVQNLGSEIALGAHPRVRRHVDVVTVGKVPKG